MVADSSNAQGQGDPAGGSGTADWLRNGRELVGRTYELAGQLQLDWDSLSQRASEWTTDTIMNEVVNSWEHFTPVMGEWIQHGIDAMSIGLRTAWPAAGEHLRAVQERARSLPAGERPAAYLDIQGFRPGWAHEPAPPRRPAPPTRRGCRGSGGWPRGHQRPERDERDRAVGAGPEPLLGLVVGHPRRPALPPAVDARLRGRIVEEVQVPVRGAAHAAVGGESAPRRRPDRRSGGTPRCSSPS